MFLDCNHVVEGLLPKPFAAFPDGIRIPATGMNKFNREDKSRFVCCN
jgi:hypothetical protein